MHASLRRVSAFRYREWLWPLLWAGVIFATSCRFIERGPFVRFVQRFLPAGAARQAWECLWLLGGLFIVKGYHMAEFALLFTLVYLTARRRTAWPDGRVVLLSTVFCVLYAASDEWHQTFVPGRGGTVTDVCIDSAGVGMAALFVRGKWAGVRTGTR